MKSELFAVFDMAANQYIELFTGPTVDFALRGFKEACTTPDHQMAKFPEDYALYHFGCFDHILGIIEAQEPRKIALASSFVNGRQIDLVEQLADDDVAGLYEGKKVVRS